MAANLTRIFSSFCIRNTFEGQRMALPAVYSSPWHRPPSVQQPSSYHTSACLCGGRLKSEWRRKRAPALTKLCLEKSEKFKTRKAFGGGSKTKVTRAKKGSYIWKSQDVQFESPILDVLSNTAHKDFTERKIMVKGSIVEVDAERFNEERESKEIAEDIQDLSKNIDDKVLQQIKSGKVLAKVSSRPGQEGKVDGYLLEGEELDAYLNETKASDLHSNT